MGAGAQTQVLWESSHRSSPLSLFLQDFQRHGHVYHWNTCGKIHMKFSLSMAHRCDSVASTTLAALWQSPRSQCLLTPPPRLAHQLPVLHQSWRSLHSTSASAAALLSTSQAEAYSMSSHSALCPPGSLTWEHCRTLPPESVPWPKEDTFYASIHPSLDTRGSSAIGVMRL